MWGLQENCASHAPGGGSEVVDSQCIPSRTPEVTVRSAQYFAASEPAPPALTGGLFQQPCLAGIGDRCGIEIINTGA